MRTFPSVGWITAVFAFVMLTPATSQALQIAPEDVKVEVLNAAGEPETRAGAHPDRVIMSFEVSQAPGAPDESSKHMIVDLPAGFTGDPSAVATCPREDFSSTTEGEPCPPESQVGMVATGFGGEVPVYNVEPAPNEPALFGAIQFIPLKFFTSLRPTDAGLRVDVNDLISLPAGAVEGQRVELWGIPADHQEGTSIARRPLLTLPTRCGSPFGVVLGLESWEQPNLRVSGAGDTGRPLAGCESLAFEPAVGIAIEKPVADSASGADLEVTLTQDSSPDGRATSQMEGARVLLPEGMTIAPGGAQGLRSCSDEQFGKGLSGEPRCPAASRVGTIEMKAPQFATPLSGEIFLGEERPGERFRLFMAARGLGAEAKIAGTLQPDPESGRLVANLRELPQSAFTNMRLRFFGGPGALMATPLGCGRAPASASFTPYSGTPPVPWQGSVEFAPIGGGSCAAPPFAPSFAASLGNAEAGAPTALTTTVSRRDGEQLQERFRVELPAGMGAALGAVEACGAGEAAAGSCGPGSRIGSAAAELGPGAEPARLGGDVYLTDSHRRAAYGVAIVFPVRMGPFDFGTIVVRGALRVDPLSGRVTIETDRLPRSVGGIAVRFQSLRLGIDRPGFLRNPTSCRPGAALATITAFGGAVATGSAPLRAGGCVDLPFRPRLRMALRGRSQLHRHGKPSLRIGVRMRPGGANLRRVELRLPALLGFDSGGLRAICARGRAVAGACPRGARVGSASARSPLLGAPLQGSLYLVQPQGNGTPDLWASLRGGGIRIELQVETEEEGGRVTTRLRDLPDFALDSFSMRFASGERGLLRLERGVCAGGEPRRPRTPVELEGQNQARRQARVPLAIAARCGDG